MAMYTVLQFFRGHGVVLLWIDMYNS